MNESKPYMNPQGEVFMKDEPNDIVELRRRVAKAKELSEFNHQIGFNNRGNHVLGAFLTGVLQEYDTLRAERDAWKNRATAAEAERDALLGKRHPLDLRCPECDGRKCHVNCVYTLRAERDEWKNRAEKAERRVFEERTNRAFAVRAVEAERDDVIAICRGTQMDDAAITSMRKYVEEKLELEKLAHGRGDELGRCLIALSKAEAERDELLKVYEAAEDFIGAQGTQYESDQYLMLCGVVGAYNQQRGIHESQ